MPMWAVPEAAANRPTLPGKSGMALPSSSLGSSAGSCHIGLTEKSGYAQPAMKLMNRSPLGRLIDPHALGDAGDGPVGVEDVGFPAAFLDDLNELDGLPDGHRPDLPVRRLAAVEREIDIDNLVHDHLPPLIYLRPRNDVNEKSG